MPDHQIHHSSIPHFPSSKLQSRFHQSVLPTPLSILVAQLPALHINITPNIKSVPPFRHLQITRRHISITTTTSTTSCNLINHLIQIHRIRCPWNVTSGRTNSMGIAYRIIYERSIPVVEFVTSYFVSRSLLLLYWSFDYWNTSCPSNVAVFRHKGCIRIDTYRIVLSPRKMACIDILFLLHGCGISCTVRSNLNIFEQYSNISINCNVLCCVQ